MPILNNESLSRYSTFHIGGPARHFTIVETVEDLRAAFHWAKREREPILMVGKGSNTLFHDKGFNGFVILNKIDGVEWENPSIVKVGAGHSFSHLGVMTARKGLNGLEFASGIPATVGGAIFMNAGANGTETCEALSSVNFIYPDGSSETMTKNQMSFSYRTSGFQKMAGAIVSARFTLQQKENARSKQIEIIRYRQATQPYGEASCGCIFRNPPTLSAGRLIEEAGLKGFQIGGAKVSEKHANFIINAGKATAVDVLNLIDHIKETVLTTSCLHLENELRVTPYDQPI